MASLCQPSLGGSREGDSRFRPSELNLRHMRYFAFSRLHSLASWGFSTLGSNPPKRVLIWRRHRSWTSLANKHRWSGDLSPQTPELEVNVKEKLSIHPLAVGPGYKKEDVKVVFANPLYNYTSGVCVGGVNKGVKFIHHLTKSNVIKSYQLTGILGKASDNLYYTGKIVEKSSYKHVHAGSFHKILMIIQASHQRKALDLFGPDYQSQQAYEIMSKEGLVRPSESFVPIIYSLKCLEFKPPHFVIEVSCVNEDENYLLSVIHDIGLMLKTNATTSKVRCIRYGPYNVDHALLHKHWRLPYIIENIAQLYPVNELAIIDTPNLKKLQKSEQLEDSNV